MVMVPQILFQLQKARRDLTASRCLRRRAPHPLHPSYIFSNKGPFSRCKTHCIEAALCTPEIALRFLLFIFPIEPQWR